MKLYDWSTLTEVAKMQRYNLSQSLVKKSGHLQKKFPLLYFGHYGNSVLGLITAFEKPVLIIVYLDESKVASKASYFYSFRAQANYPTMHL